MVENVYTQDERRTLLRLARSSLEHGLARGRALEVDVARYSSPLRDVRASFVTLLSSGVLRGCIGSLVPVAPLATDVTRRAFQAGFEDPRFLPLDRAEVARVLIQVSVLSDTEPIPFSNEEGLLEQLYPGTDGLIIHGPDRQATFLPSVWESLPDPVEFLGALKRKAGLSETETPARAERYTTESFGEDENEGSPASGTAFEHVPDPEKNAR